jgi:nicotinate-nucleotide adenylyltransferase
MTHVGLFFGSFNPIHNGHLMLANYMAEFSDLDEVWFVVSPHNPLKEKKTLLGDRDRLYMVELALEGQDRFHVSDIEFRLPKPSFTVDTLVYLNEKHPKKEFSIIMGSDGLPTFHKWKNFQLLSEKYKRYVYPRPGIESIKLSEHKNITLVDAPQMGISSTFIRKAVKEEKQIDYFLPKKVYDYILEMGFYK